MRILVACVLVLFLLTGVARARTWTDATGQQQVEGDLVGVSTEGKVLLRMTDGKLQSAPLSKFSAADRKYIEEQTGAAAAATPDAEGAAKRLAAQLAAKPQDSRGYYARGTALFAAGKTDDAIQDFTKSLELDPKFAEAYDGRGLAHMKSGKSVPAHQDFSRAIELHPELASAYRHRADNLMAASKIEGDRQILEELAAKHLEALSKRTRENPWPPIQPPEKPSGPAITLLAKRDHDAAESLESSYSPYGVSPYSVPLIPGQGWRAPGLIVPPALVVHPAEGVQGADITLVAHRAPLAAGMPEKTGRYRGTTRPSLRAAERVEIAEVEFYWDEDGDGRLNTNCDRFLGVDADGNDGYSIKVSTAAFVPGRQAYFALPKGREGSGTDPAWLRRVIDAIGMLESVAAAEREIARICNVTGQGDGLTQEAAEELAARHERANADARYAYLFVSGVDREATAALKDAAAQMKLVEQLLSAPEAAPKEKARENAAACAKGAASAAARLSEAACRLSAAAEVQAGAAAVGRVSSGSGVIKPK